MQVRVHLSSHFAGRKGTIFAASAEDALARLRKMRVGDAARILTAEGLPPIAAKLFDAAAFESALGAVEPFREVSFSEVLP